MSIFFKGLPIHSSDYFYDIYRQKCNDWTQQFFTLTTKKQEKTMLTYRDISREQFNEAKQKSIEHHQDGAERNCENYREFSLGDEDCALCGIFNFGRGVYCTNNKLCPLYEKENDNNCCGEWIKAINAQDRKAGYGSFMQFHEAEVALVKRLQSLDYNVWLAEKRRGERFFYRDERWEYTGEFRYAEENDCVLWGELNDNGRIELMSFNNIKLHCKFHIVKPVEQEKQALSAQIPFSKDINSNDWKVHVMSYGRRAGKSLQICNTCEHDYEPVGKSKSKEAKSEVFEAELHDYTNDTTRGPFKWRYTGEVKVAERNEYYNLYNEGDERGEVYIVKCYQQTLEHRIVERADIEPEVFKAKLIDHSESNHPDKIIYYKGEFKFKVKETEIRNPKYKELYCRDGVGDSDVYIASYFDSGLHVIVDFADEDERQRYYALKYTREIDSVKFRVYKDKDKDFMVITWDDNGSRSIESVLRIGNIICKALNIPIMPYSESHGDFKYPE